MSKKYKYIKIGIASPEEILSWSHGEVETFETDNYRTHKSEANGLYSEKIFGPVKNYQCACGKSKRSDVKGKVCEKCGVEITFSKVRRERMGHILLQSPIVHPWFFKNNPSIVAILLDIKAKDIERIVYYAAYVITNPGPTGRKQREIIDEGTYINLYEQYGRSFEALTGAEAIKRLLSELDLEKEVTTLRKKLKSSSKQKRDKVIKRLEVLESFYHSDNKPEWIVMTVLPVLPPELRPILYEKGITMVADLTSLYQNIIICNNRLKKQFERRNGIQSIIKNGKRMLQIAVDALFDNSKLKHPVKDRRNVRVLKSLSDKLRGKKGRFRKNLLGKRVDYSGRSVIVVGPFLKMYQCGIPREMALTLFKPFVLRGLKGSGMSIGAAKQACEQQQDIVWRILENVIIEHPVLLNRAPTLHRLGIQAFEPVLIEGKAIRLHPLVTTAFNADFDGDQMAVHVPLSEEAQAEARILMLASNNILNPKDGKPVVTPSQDMILGNYYLTLERKFSENEPKEYNEGKFFLNKDEAYIAYKNGEITLHTRVFVDPSYLPESRFKGLDIKGKYLFTTLGKMIFNEILPSDFPYVNEPTDYNLTKALPEKYLFKPSTKEAYDAMINLPEVDPFKKKFIAKIIGQVFKVHQMTETSRMLDRLKDLGFLYSTVSGITISAADVSVYGEKDRMIKESDEEVARIKDMFDLGLLTDKERSKMVESVWSKTREDIQKGLWDVLSNEKDNHIFMMADSGSRGSASNFAQLAGMRGLMNNPTGDVIEVPVKANFKEGLSVSEFFISTHGARKGSTDTALKTAESGYLTRRLVDVSQDVIVSQEDCGTERGFDVSEIKDAEGKSVVSLADRITGRFLAKDVVDPQTGEVLAHRNEALNEEQAALIESRGITVVSIRSNITCNSRFGVCKMCYGRNLATNKIVEVGEAVGTIAAQSIGEPGTQLTMRTFHTGGVASTADITQGLPRVQELFEARKPKGKATITEIDGTVVSIEKTKVGQVITIKGSEGEKTYTVDMTSELLVDVGSDVKRGDRLMKGSLAPKELLRICDAQTVQRYIIEEVQKVYRSQGVEISDKHIEIIVRQMMRKVHVESEGSTGLLPGRDVSIREYQEEVKKVVAEGGVLPTAKPIVLGITKAALASDSFLSAASFQETTRVLTDAAIRGKVDYLLGLKENIIIGGLIPAGTGTLIEDSFTCEHKPADDDDDEFTNDDNSNDDIREVMETEEVDVAENSDESFDEESDYVDSMLD